MVRGASAALTARDARNAPSTSTEAIVANANSGLTSSAIVANPSTRSSIRRPAVELPPDRGADEVGAVGVEPLVDQQIDLAQVDQPDVDGDFLALVDLSHAVTFSPSANQPSTIPQDGKRLADQLCASRDEL